MDNFFKVITLANVHMLNESSSEPRGEHQTMTSGSRGDWSWSNQNMSNRYEDSDSTGTVFIFAAIENKAHLGKI